MRVKVATGGKTKDVAITDVTPENYIVPDNERHLYHCIIEVRKFDSETGKRLSVPRVQKFGKKSFENTVQQSLKLQGYTVTILHDPNEFINEQAALKAVRAEEQRKKEEEEKQKAREEEKSAMKAEILAELRASGIIPENPVKTEKGTKE